MLSTGFQTDWRHTVWAWWCLLLFFLETWRTSSSLIFSAGVGERGVAGGVNGWMRCLFTPPEPCEAHFITDVRTIMSSELLTKQLPL